MPNIPINNNSPQPEESEDGVFHQKEIKDDLMDIYRDGDGKIPDMSRIEIDKKSRLKLFLARFFSFLFIIGLIGLVVYLVIQRVNYNNQGKQSLSLEVQAPQVLASGDKIVYKINYINNEQAALNNNQLNVDYPEGFVFESADPAPSSEYKNVWQLGRLEVGEKKLVTIIGRLIASPDSEQNLKIIASYEPENFHSEFQKSVFFATKIVANVIDLTIEGPDKILADQSTIYKIKYKNNSDQPIEKMQIELVYPSDFKFLEASPAPSSPLEGEKQNNLWLVESLGGLSSGEINIKGSYPQNLTQDQQLKVQIKIKDLNDQPKILTEKDFTSHALGSALSLNLIINGASADNSANFDDWLNYSIVYKNKSDTSLNNVKISVQVLASAGDTSFNFIDWSKITDDNHGQFSDNQINWTSNEISELTSLDAGEEGVIDFKIKLKSYQELEEQIKKISSTDYKIVSQASLQGENSSATQSDGQTLPIILKSNQITTRILSNATFAAQARYFNDDNIAVGSGPLPPKVGQITKYRIYWTIGNSLHELENITITANLSPNIDFSNRTNAAQGEISYSSSSRAVNWTVKSIAAKAGEIEADFEVEVTPREEDLNKIISLLGQSTLTATDKQNNFPLTLNAKPFTSNLDGDPIAEGKGLVTN